MTAQISQISDEFMGRIAMDPAFAAVFAVLWAAVFGATIWSWVKRARTPVREDRHGP